MSLTRKPLCSNTWRRYAGVLPNRTDATRWLLDVQDNIERHFPTGAVGALEELRVMCESLAVAIVKRQVSIYSFVLKHG